MGVYYSKTIPKAEYSISRGKDKKRNTCLNMLSIPLNLTANRRENRVYLNESRNEMMDNRFTAIRCFARNINKSICFLFLL